MKCQAQKCEFKEIEYAVLHKDGSEAESSSTGRHHGLKGDVKNIILLTLLYVLQGVPLGLSASIPLILQTKKVGYDVQARFSFIDWPFSMKLLWAPIVDSLYVKKFGRRKTWLMPTQYLIGIFMLYLSTRVDGILGKGENGSGNIDLMTLFVVFFFLNFLAATQDISLDGWAISMLARHNVGWASTCNSVGQTAGIFLGNVLFLTLESADFCNKYLRSQPSEQGIITFSGFLYFWGFVFFTVTTLVLIFKPERLEPGVDHEQGIVETYRQLYRVMKLKPVITYTIQLLTAKVAFVAVDAVSQLKLIDAGVSKTTIALYAVPLVPIQLILPFVISKHSAGPRPLNVFLKVYLPKLSMTIFMAFLVYLAGGLTTDGGELPYYFYILLLAFYMINEVFCVSMFVSRMAFNAKVSDPAIGGTYMTLLNTLGNLGWSWPSTLGLWLVSAITWKSCDSGQLCTTAAEEQACTAGGGNCVTLVDGYYIECVVCLGVGVLWYLWKQKETRQLDNLEIENWKIS
ncbi:acetyl-coenzyme A transporter 1-like isoform X2 [Mya arenaria]|uniref:acetyl-coenzyme A transporter 1-like isoform X2 n=1 Tax=Mya arenaria TaxID=6604 RepID=UPI0022E749A4|nr:acetyl-coenzyme A transporter 1-like isoform X2 [Mya arenaria]